MIKRFYIKALMQAPDSRFILHRQNFNDYVSPWSLPISAGMTTDPNNTSVEDDNEKIEKAIKDLFGLEIHVGAGMCRFIASVGNNMPKQFLIYLVDFVQPITLKMPVNTEVLCVTHEELCVMAEKSKVAATRVVCLETIKAVSATKHSLHMFGNYRSLMNGGKNGK
jgi:hypothetical protein